ncbi:MAG: hypothetical protein E6Q69_11395, partial [Aquipseudomonas alcaligenes]
NQWPDARGTGGRITVESVARCSWNGWPDGRGIRRRPAPVRFTAAALGALHSSNSARSATHYVALTAHTHLTTSRSVPYGAFNQRESCPPSCRIDGRLSRQLEQAPFSEDSARPTTKVSDSWKLRWWVMSHDGYNQIQQPDQLRDEVRQRLLDALDLQPDQYPPL